ncbi:hypothetical protein BCR42DRAFT_406587 [Absidia repens]|uniref:polynucleotide adenylyltransferase n=1 Tax=Absidia repens TaxID=90262 RepID=A0A1X2IV32_9FUNG|nr:hypothetical protein BCR42DRAFT_406587 [Absidia repens]
MYQQTMPLPLLPDGTNVSVVSITPNGAIPTTDCWNNENKHFAVTATAKAVSLPLRSTTSSNCSFFDPSSKANCSPSIPASSTEWNSAPIQSAPLSCRLDECLSLTADVPFILDHMAEDQLCAFMLNQYEELLPTKENYYRRIALVQKIGQLLNNEWPNKGIKAILFGSSVNGLGTNQSDVDICITSQWSGLRSVRALATLFIRCGMQQVIYVPRAQVPIVRLFDPETQLACDININSTMALYNTDMIKAYTAIDPRVRPLIMIIKHWTKQRILNDSAAGGTLSTYTWTCMIINFLQLRQPPILPVLHQMKSPNGENEMFCSNIETLQGYGQPNCETLGGLLFAFFRRYSIEFDYDEQVISVRHGRYLTKQEKGWHIGRNKASLCVEEPFNVGRNLGNSADIRSIRGIRMELNRGLEMLIAGVSWTIICSPYQHPTFETFTSVSDASKTFYYEDSLCSENNETNIIDSYYGSNKRNNSLHSTTELMAREASLPSTSTSSSTPPSSLLPSSPASSSSSTASPPPPPVSVSPAHQSLHRSPNLQQKVIDSISAKYTPHILNSQQHYYKEGNIYHWRNLHHPLQNQYSNRTWNRKRIDLSSKHKQIRNHHINSTGEFALISQHYLPTPVSITFHQGHRYSQQQRQQRQQQLEYPIVTKTSELTHTYQLPTNPSAPAPPYTVKIKLPPKEKKQ